MDFGVALLNDVNHMQLWYTECRGDCEMVVIKILQEWLRGNGRAVTWQDFVEALRECQLLLKLADQIEDIKIKGMFENRVFYLFYCYSLS